MTIRKISTRSLDTRREFNMKLIPPSKVEVRMTSDKGWGVFATDYIYEGEIIEETPLITLPIDVKVYTDLLNDYRFNWPRVDDPLEMVLPMGYGCTYNHSEDNNAVWEDHPEYKAFQFIAIRDIEPGEEVCIYYGDEMYWSEGREEVGNNLK